MLPLQSKHQYPFPIYTVLAIILDTALKSQPTRCTFIGNLSGCQKVFSRNLKPFIPRSIKGSLNDLVLTAAALFAWLHLDISYHTLRAA